ncbi:MAG: hypothetical protein GF330_09005, partial [Candidatus Eisenbacteria bacterium]|nr:hypothetical protein [Candidatus Eisenbacteria bacterium]
MLIRRLSGGIALLASLALGVLALLSPAVEIAPAISGEDPTPAQRDSLPPAADSLDASPVVDRTA